MSNWTVLNFRGTAPSLGINIVTNGANGSLTLSGTNTVQVGGINPNTGLFNPGTGGGTLVNVKGTGSATTTLPER
jgi:hypothetical protein